MADQPLDEERPPPPHGYAPGIRDTGKSSADGGKSGSKLVAGFAFGIGSAAIVAALLYAGRRKSREKLPGRGEPGPK
ncbi:MAG TPA: hypothetical protein VJ859_16410 [Allosphingosinicella sp.]|nr:hypothetical protein [Allosphingosinicella sp.]